MRMILLLAAVSLACAAGGCCCMLEDDDCHECRRHGCNHGCWNDEVAFHPYHYQAPCRR